MPESRAHREANPAPWQALNQPRSITVAIAAAAAATGLAALALPVPAHAGSLSGTATYRERIALPPDAEFEAVLIDVALADAPARDLGRVRLRPAGRYTVRATVRQGERLLFTTDTFTPVLTGAPSQPITLRLVAVGAGRPLVSSSPLGRLPASWRGDLPAASGTTRWQVDLSGDGSFQLRQTFLDRPAPNRFDDIGRWRLEPGGNRLVLRGGREAPLVFQPLAGGAALRKLDPRGEPIRSRQPDRLQRLATPRPIDPRLHLLGMFRYQADAASIRLCATGARLPVAMEADYQRLEQAYLKAQPEDRTGQPSLVNLEGLITNRPSAEPGRGPQRTLVVERFVGVHPGQECPQANASAPPAPHSMASPSLRGTLWRLQALQGSSGPTLFKPPGPAPELLLAPDLERVSGTGGCNRLMGGFRLAGEELSFSRLASTKMACPPAVMAFERRYGEALAQVQRWSIDKRNLLLQDAGGRTLLLFMAAL